MANDERNAHTDDGRSLEWLFGLDHRRDGYAKLLCDAGGLAPAAWRLARARCRVFETATDVPTRREVRAAARQIARRVGLDAVPAAAFLANECEAQGLLVL
jgi:hypothetical protein